MNTLSESKWEFKHQEYNLDANIQSHDSIECCQVDVLLRKCTNLASSSMEMLLLGCLDFCLVWASLA